MSPIESVIRNRCFIHSIRRDGTDPPRLATAAVLALLLSVLPLMQAQAQDRAAADPATSAAADSGGSEDSKKDVVGPDASGAPAHAPATLEQVLGTVADPLGRIERQIEAEEYAPAVAELEQHIEDIERSSHRFDPRLVEPLTLLGDAKTGLGEYETALGHYQRALHLSRVNLGLNTPEQVEIVYREAETYKVLGDLQLANDREEYAYHVLNRFHDPLDEALLPGIYHLARWYERTSNIFAARALYEQAVQIIDAHDKLETVEAIPALRGIAASYRMERFPPHYLADLGDDGTHVTASALHQPVSVNNFPAGEAALQRVIRIRQDNKAEQPVALAEAVLDLADWYTLFDKPRRAEPLYAHAWEIMSEVENFDVVGYFADPELLYFPAPGNPNPPPSEDRGERITGYVEVAFDVTEDGYVRSLSTVGSEPQGLMEFRVRKSLRLARYRPMLVEGVPVAKQAHSYRHEFPYYEQRERVPQTAAAANAGG